jgi:hypothetical protein
MIGFSLINDVDFQRTHCQNENLFVIKATHYLSDETLAPHVFELVLNSNELLCEILEVLIEILGEILVRLDDV